MVDKDEIAILSVRVALLEGDAKILADKLTNIRTFWFIAIFTSFFNDIRINNLINIYKSKTDGETTYKERDSSSQ